MFPYLYFHSPLGLVFGLALDKLKVTLPVVMRGQMDFSSNLMLKAFMSAVVASHLAILLVEFTTGIPRESRRPRALGILGGPEPLLLTLEFLVGSDSILQDFSARTVRTFSVASSLVWESTCPAPVRRLCPLSSSPASPTPG